MSSVPTPQRVVMQAKGLVKRYGQVTALDGVDFELRAGEDMTARARSAHRPRGAQARSLRSGRAYAGQSMARYASDPPKET